MINGSYEEHLKHRFSWIRQIQAVGLQHVHTDKAGAMSRKSTCYSKLTSAWWYLDCHFGVCRCSPAYAPGIQANI
ncbi:hypothetical protein Mapa_011465 [Marchantia paleacea]|nr:hypothetical protein Mapa_011465 [Marchantia paleacea]